MERLGKGWDKLSAGKATGRGLFQRRWVQDRLWSATPVWRYGLAVLLTAMGMLLRWILFPVIGQEGPYIFIFPAITLSAVLGGFRPALLAAILGVLGTEILFVEPFWRMAFTVSTMIRMLMILLSGVLLGYIGYALRAREWRLRGMFERAAMGIVEVDAEDRFVAVNDHICRMLGYRREQLLGQNVHALTHPEDRPRSDDLNARLHTGELDELDYEKRYLKADGSALWVHVTVSAIRDTQGRQVRAIGTIEDITERKRAEEAQKKFREELEIQVTDRTAELQTANRDLLRSNQDLEQFAYVASHDLQEPLRMVASFTQLLERRSQDKLDEKAQEYLRFVLQAVERMQGLIRDLLAYSRIHTQAQPFIPIDCRELVQEVLQTLAVPIEESHAQVAVDDLPTVQADRTQLFQVFQNLIGNALKFRRPDRPPKIRIASEARDHEWIFRVQDNGIGIERQHFSKIFLVFQRLNSQKQYPGSGIGLSIVKRIVERHGGQVGVESKPGNGATFCFTLPRT